uniref:Uncharacterized protein n=1 Tax=Anguilla anguilla TaxID=7936 RepID=A0A0E9TSU7_ANGAN
MRSSCRWAAPARARAMCALGEEDSVLKRLCGISVGKNRRALTFQAD